MSKKIKAEEHESYNNFSIISFLIPFVGFILGIVYITKDSPLEKKLGEHLIVVSVIGSFVGGLIYYFFIVPTLYSPL